MDDNHRPQTVLISRLTWARLVLALRRRGGGVRESGAFLLGTIEKGKGKVRGFICYDDVDANAYQRGAIAFHASGFAALWAHCRKTGQDVIADVHTHPGSDTRQSQIDQRHPIIPIVGHTALILPRFADMPIWSMRGVGVHEYLGSFRWKHHREASAAARLKLTWW